MRWMTEEKDKVGDGIGKTKWVKGFKKEMNEGRVWNLCGEKMNFF